MLTLNVCIDADDDATAVAAASGENRKEIKTRRAQSVGAGESQRWLNGGCADADGDGGGVAAYYLRLMCDNNNHDDYRGMGGKLVDGQQFF